MTAPDLLRFVAGPVGIVVGILLIVFRIPWSAAARRARSAKGDSDRAVASQTPRLYLVIGCFLILWGLLVLLYSR